ncbi:hypothetical protein ACIPL1_10690 [Pseudomonas sp. NPDC090202]|uniref:hypothetical protein n=1 Tax=Pseudomonas sp. NPDC090202 TaxID=3364476 RepID=UPI003802F21B
MSFSDVAAMARVEIARIKPSQTESVLDQQIAYATGYIRCARDNGLITEDQWRTLTHEIETEKTSWISERDKVRKLHQASAEIEVESALKHLR